MKHFPPLPLLVLCLATGPALAQKSRPIPTGCQEDFSNCREDCSMDYGSSTRTYNQLTACFRGCVEKRDVCRDRHYTVLDSGLAPGALDRPREDDPAMVEPTRRPNVIEYQRPDDVPSKDTLPARSVSEDSEDEGPLPSSEPDSGPTPLRSGVYRAPAPPKPAKPEPVAAPPMYDASADEDGSLPPAPPPPAEDDEEEDLPPPRRAEPMPAPEPKAIAEPAPEVRETPRPARPTHPPPPPEPKKYDISEWDPNADD